MGMGLGMVISMGIGMCRCFGLAIDVGIGRGIGLGIGTEWCGVGVVCYGMAWHGMAWHGVARYAWVWSPWYAGVRYVYMHTYIDLIDSLYVSFPWLQRCATGSLTPQSCRNRRMDPRQVAVEPSHLPRSSLCGPFVAAPGPQHRDIDFPTRLLLRNVPKTKP